MFILTSIKSLLEALVGVIVVSKAVNSKPSLSIGIVSSKKEPGEHPVCGRLVQVYLLLPTQD